jgi:hypothetical protein
VFASRVPDPTATLLAPEVRAVREFLPIAVLFPPETEASKALSPRTVLPATEFAPLPTVTLLILKSSLLEIFAAVTWSSPILAVVTDPFCSIAVVTVLLLGVPIFTVEPRTIAK